MQGLEMGRGSMGQRANPAAREQSTMMSRNENIEKR
jgi:hypothetical protein